MSLLQDLTKYASGRARSNDRARIIGCQDVRSFHNNGSGSKERDSQDSKGSKNSSLVSSSGPVTQALKGEDSRLSNLNLVCMFLIGLDLANSQACSQLRSRLPQDHDTFNDNSKSVGGQSLGGVSIYNDAKIWYKGLGGKYDDNLNA